MPDVGTLRRWIRTAASTPPRQSLRLARDRLADAARQRTERTEDATKSTYLTDSETPAVLRSYVRLPDIALARASGPALAGLAEAAIDHRFDLLGSGPVVVRHGATCPGLEGILFPQAPRVEADADGAWLVGRAPAASLPEAQRIWRLVDPGYVPIDWQLDFRSGYRWSERVWSRDVRYGDVRGADVKLPWELARMQHLPRLALAAAAVADTDSELASRCAREFRNEVLDFVATNPPRFGVNWTTTMDVAIRAVNWLVAWDLFRSVGIAFDHPFEAAFRRTVLEHARHIAWNLEWAAVGRGNHYLADIVGLLFLAAWLPHSEESNGWLSLASSELVAEAERQLHPDGSGFEASTCYHRLSAEMVTWATALLIRLQGAAAVTDVLLERLAGAARFTIALTKPNARVAQIGDNDSGRFLPLLPAHPLDHRHLVAAIGGLLDRGDLRAYGREWDLEATIVRSLAGAGVTSAGPIGQRASRTLEVADRPVEPLVGSSRLDIVVGPGARAGLRALSYPDFGIFVLRSDRIFLAIRCGSVGQDGQGGHGHNDQLSIELSVDGEDWIRDPGTYVYTPLPDRRNEYRSVRAHFVPVIGDAEPSRLDQGLFILGRPVIGRCLAFGPEGFTGELHVGRAVLRAHYAIEDDRVAIRYEFGGVPPDPRLAGGDWRALLPTMPFSPGYGVVETDGR